MKDPHFIITESEIIDRIRTDDIIRCPACGKKQSITKSEEVTLVIKLKSSGKTKKIPDGTINRYIMGALSKVPNIINSNQ